MARWDKIKSRGNVEDRRGLTPIIGGISLTGLALYIGLNLLLGADASDILNGLSQLPTQQEQVVDTTDFEGKDEYEVFASTVLGSNNQLWREKIRGYQEPTLVLFRDATQSACGGATSAVGPHYCPLDETIYLDETFFDELTYRFGARGGDVAEAYVIAHEVGHHVQHLLGKAENITTNEGSIKLELQADCYAGVWVNSIKDLDVLGKDEVLEAIDAAAAVGDDRIQESITGRINPETWTHGSSEMRVESFERGYATGDPDRCSTS